MDEHGPEDAVEWVLTWCPAKPVVTGEADRISKHLHATGVAHTLFGRRLGNGLWTYAIAKDVVGPFDTLAASVPFLWREAPRPATEFQRALEALEQLGLGDAVSTSCSIPEAVERSRRLAQLRAELDVEVEVQLQCGEPFDLGEVHELLTGAGLLPADGPMYEPAGRPDSFAVEVYQELLRLYLNVPRTTEPDASFDAMLTLLATLEAELPGSARVLPRGATPSSLRARVLEVVEQLEANGFQPGAQATLMLF